MSKRTVWITALLLLGAAAASAQVSHRPIEDFTTAQINVLGWYNGNNPEFSGVIDFGGVVHRLLLANCDIDLGSTFSGDITEKALTDTTTQVHVVLHGKQIFMRAVLYADGTPVLGYTRSEVCHGAVPMLGDFMMTLDFINNQGVGGPLPDLAEMSGDPNVLPFLQSVLLNGNGQGPLRFLYEVPPGTPGFMHVVQRGPYVRGKGVPGKDGFPVELVEVKALGK